MDKILIGKDFNTYYVASGNTRDIYLYNLPDSLTNIEDVLFVTNLTQNINYYAPDQSLSSGTTISSTDVITFGSSHPVLSSNDKLFIVIAKKQNALDEDLDIIKTVEQAVKVPDTVLQLASLTDYGLEKTHNGSNDSATFTDSTTTYSESNVDIGGTIYNTTDGSYGTITAASSNNITATLTGGTDNDWDTSDVARIDSVIRYEIFMGNQSDLSLQWILTAGTSNDTVSVKVYKTLLSDADTDSDDSWVEIDMSGYTNTVSNGTVTDMLHAGDGTKFVYKYMVKVFTSVSTGNFSNAIDLYYIKY